MDCGDAINAMLAAVTTRYIQAELFGKRFKRMRGDGPVVSGQVRAQVTIPGSLPAIRFQQAWRRRMCGIGV
jgi:hypothetical protein